MYSYTFKWILDIETFKTVFRQNVKISKSISFKDIIFSVDDFTLL